MIILNILSKYMQKSTGNTPTIIYFNKIENRTTFRIKTTLLPFNFQHPKQWSYLEALKKITKDKNGENLEVSQVFKSYWSNISQL